MDYFPLTIATGKAFCNRKEELKYLVDNINDLKPTLLVSPRRYGKTSLAINAIHYTKLAYAQFDFLSTINETDVEKCILKGVGGILSKIETGVRKAIKLANDLFSGLDVKVSFRKMGVAIEIAHKHEKPAYNILQILERVDFMARKYRKKIILFFDEFQRICEISQDHSIESVIRQIAQESKHMMFIFSGSNRHLLHQMFNDRSRPLYKMCDRLLLERISSDEYRKYMQYAAQQTWKKLLDDTVLDKIFTFSERHPYYINLLCSRIWKQKFPNKDHVEAIWQNYVAEERSQVAAEMDLLSKNQRKLLVVLARYHGTNAPRSNEFEQKAEMSGATITQALDFLEKRDYIFKDKNNYYNVLDPLIKVILSES